ncbi:hybrid sensor histidine kinase/response regulator transcription factor [Pedobacter heparinus]|uniref:histidine kinase n=1 Tax=Pedobacter heparinus (strain ATCC 13125 / DSM 2366 / CIP 104194 / JCM 7457 / NBRC 12017 / NCIMB 9290 / NRRL B-14731 / HIM 762-3) TaxID=485917 RepID=C6Y0G8_PEDHD|nr:hybrid sensor histidine kinase/response regulator transcription factor [Pedobacter heparinus]ACU02729.1 response regulator receiver [Pedobacter heparinus DSM 2366]
MYTKLTKLFLVFFLLFSVVSIGYSQSYSFRHYQVENGLSYNSVICSLQDKKGFLWFGTKDGLNRFDGYTFKIFRNDPDNPESIGNNFIHSLYEDKNQTIWIGTLTGLYKYDPLKESFSLVPPSKGYDIRDVSADSRGNIWYITGLFLSRYNVKTKQNITYRNKSHTGTTSISISEKDDIWVSSADGFIQRYQPATDSFISYKVFDKSKPAISPWIEKVYHTNKGYLLVGTSNQGIKIFDIHTLSYRDLLTSNPDNTAIYARDFMDIGNDRYWIATESGLFIYDMKTGKYKNLRNKFNDPYSISDNAVYTLCKDKEGGIFVGTYFGGVNYYAKEFTSFDKFFPQASGNSLSGYAVKEICNDKYGNLWIGTEDAGLNRLNAKTGVFEHFKPGGGKTTISHTNIHGLLATDDELWVGTFERGLDVIDINTLKVIRHYQVGNKPNQLKSNFIESILKTRSGDILLGSSYGLYRYNKHSDDFSLLNEVPGNLHYQYLMEDNSGNIWAGSLRDGLYIYNNGDRRSTSYKFEENNTKSLSSNAINSIFQDSQGNIWVATENGLNRFNEKDKSFARYTTKNGFPSNVFYRILEDQKQNLWISTSRGLVCFSPDEKITLYTRSNGLLNDQFNYGSAYKNKNGRMYFGSVKGMISFLPDEFRKNQFVPPIYITGFQVYNKELQIGQKNSPLAQSINFTRVLNLEHHQSTFSIDFAALGYTAPEMTEYTYTMEGLDQNWTYLKTNRKVYFTNLAPGTYTFKVKATNSSGIWNPYVASLKIVISPPYWASPMAYLLYFIIVVTAIYYGIKYYHQRTSDRNKRRIERWESKKETELYQAKIEFFTYVTHEIKTPLTLIKGPLEEVMRHAEALPQVKENLTTMEKNTNRLIELTDQLLGFRKTEIEGFNLSFVNVNINDILKENCSRFKTAIEHKKLELTVDLPEMPLYAYADPEALNKIFSNLIDNAVKYSRSEISVKLVTYEHNFVITVASDGKVIPENFREKIFEPFFRMTSAGSERGAGIGLALARSLTELHEGTLGLKNEDKKYNNFVLTLPIRHEQEFKISLTETSPIAKSISQKKDATNCPVILVVEDNTEIRTFIAGKLAKDFEVLQAGNGQEALDILKEKSTHLIISDIMMPVLDGIALCRAVKENLEYAHIPIILLTAKNTLQSKIEGLEVGADAYLEKPFSPDHLLTQVSNLLAGRDKIKNYFASSPLVHIKSMAYNKADEAFLETLYEAIHKNLDNKSLDVDQLAEIMHMSRPTLYRKIKAISNLSPHELINITRLKRAAELLAEGNHKILKIASMTGFSSQTQFGRSFLKQFGMTPSEYAASKQLTIAGQSCSPN